MAAPVLPLIVAGTGLYLAWFGVHYWDSTTKWPTDPVKAVLTGKGIPTPTGQTPASDVATQVENTQSNPPVAAATGTQSALGVAGGTFSRAQLMNLWTLKGGSAGTANIAAAIALAESGGRSTVTSTQAGAAGGASCINVGLWQLATCGKGAGYTVTQLQNPDTNAQLAIMGSANGTNWSAWETYANGAYKQFLS
jgi:hypothetical protein